MNAPSSKSALAVIVAVGALLCAGWAQAETIQIPKGAVCKVVSTTIKVDAKGRVVITDKKVCEVPSK